MLLALTILCTQSGSDEIEPLRALQTAQASARKRLSEAAAARSRDGALKALEEALTLQHRALASLEPFAPAVAAGPEIAGDPRVRLHVSSFPAAIGDYFAVRIEAPSGFILDLQWRSGDSWESLGEQALWRRTLRAAVPFATAGEIQLRLVAISQSGRRFTSTETPVRIAPRGDVRALLRQRAIAAWFALMCSELANDDGNDALGVLENLAEAAAGRTICPLRIAARAQLDGNPGLAADAVEAWLRYEFEIVDRTRQLVALQSSLNEVLASYRGDRPMPDSKADRLLDPWLLEKAPGGPVGSCPCEPPLIAAPRATAGEAAAIGRLIENFASADPAQRDLAERRVADFGRQSVLQLREAARSCEAEVRGRSLRLLGQLDAQPAATEALVAMSCATDDRGIRARFKTLLSEKPPIDALAVVMAAGTSGEWNDAHWCAGIDIIVDRQRSSGAWGIDGDDPAATYWCLRSLGIQEAAVVRKAVRWLQRQDGDLEAATLMRLRPGLPSQKQIARLLRNDPAKVDPLVGLAIAEALAAVLDVDDPRRLAWRPPIGRFECCAEGKDAASPACVQRAALYCLWERRIR